MAAVLIGAVAPHRKARVPRQRDEQLQQSGRFGPSHFRTVPPLEPSPGLVVIGLQSKLDQSGAWRQFWKPRIVEVTRRILALRYPPGRMPHGSNTEPFARAASTPESNDANGHAYLGVPQPRERR